MMMWFLSFSLLICVVLSMLGSFMSASESDSSTTKEVYECGIEPMFLKKIPYYLHFFPVGVLFLMFDVELIICLPIVGMVSPGNLNWELMWFVIGVILLVGLILELASGTLDWKE